MPVRVGVVSTDDCWLYAKYKNSFGYGQTSSGQAHRVMYEDKHGAIGHGFVLDHLCRVPSCVNPDHLEPVTHRENVIRGKTSALKQLKQPRTRPTHCKRGHLYEPNNLYHYMRGDRLERMCKACVLASMRKRDMKLKLQKSSSRLAPKEQN